MLGHVNRSTSSSAASSYLGIASVAVGSSNATNGRSTTTASRIGGRMYAAGLHGHFDSVFVSGLCLLCVALWLS